MLVWCAWCQSFLGERPPFDTYTATHTVCEACVPRIDEGEIPERITRIAAFLRQVRERFRAFDDVDVPAIMREGLALGMRPLDLAMGVLQPLLYEIGELWERGIISVADEHRFTARAAAALDELRRERAAYVQPDASPRVLLVPVDGNSHVLGVHIIELALLSASIPVHTVVPGVPVEGVVELVHRLRPEVVGASVALLPQMRAVRELVTALAEARVRYGTRLVVGGRLIARGLDLRALPELTAVEGPRSFLHVLGDRRAR